MYMRKRRIPFEMDRAQRGTLAEQMADGLRKAIHAGIYRKGDRLPAVRDLVARFGVSSRVPVAAFKILSNEGLVDAVPHKGCTVRELRSPVWKGHALCIIPSGDFSYSVAMLAGCVRSALNGAGYLLTQVTVPRTENGNLDMGLLDYALQQHVDFAVLLDGSRRLVARLERAGVPFVSDAFEGCEACKTCRGVYMNDMGPAYRQFAACCRTRKDRRAICVVKRPGESAMVAEALGRAGVAAEEWSLNPKRQGRGRLEILRRTAFNAFDSRLAEGRDWLPDVFFFNDDYMATGAMTAMCARGVRFPQDVRAATVVNVGNAPVFPGGFDRLEIDQEACGRMIAGAVLDCLSDGKSSFRLKFPVGFSPTA
jgi:DNA-binding LacI/PurR family transcriptional regulator